MLVTLTKDPIKIDYEYDDDDDTSDMEETSATCPRCGTENYTIGRLANVDHFNCRHCGAWYMKNTKIVTVAE